MASPEVLGILDLPSRSLVFESRNGTVISYETE